MSNLTSTQRATNERERCVAITAPTALSILGDYAHRAKDLELLTAIRSELLVAHRYHEAKAVQTMLDIVYRAEAAAGLQASYLHV